MVGVAAGRVQRAVVSAGWGAKAILVFVLAGLMAVPGLFVFGLVLDRQHRAEQVTDEVSALQGGSQQLLGPMLIAPYTAPRPPANDAEGVAHPQPPETGWYVVSPEQGTASVTPEDEQPAPQPVQRAGLRGDGRASTRTSRRRRPRRTCRPAPRWTGRRRRIVVGFSDLRGAETDVVGVVRRRRPARPPLAFAPDLGRSRWRARARRRSGSRLGTESSFGLVVGAGAAALSRGQGRRHRTSRCASPAPSASA